MHIYAVIAFILACVVKAFLPQTSGWEAFLLFGVAAVVYYEFIAKLPRAEEIIDLQVRGEKFRQEVDAKFSAVGLELKKAQEDAKEAKKILSENQIASGFVRRDRRANT